MGASTVRAAKVGRSNGGNECSESKKRLQIVSEHLEQPVKGDHQIEGEDNQKPPLSLEERQ